MQEDDYEYELDDQERLEAEALRTTKQAEQREAEALKRRLKNQQVAFRPIPNKEAEKVKSLMLDLASTLSAQLEFIDALIEQHAFGLRLLQPPCEGKLDVRWWKLRSGDERQPVVVKWGKDARRAGRLQPRVIERISSRIVVKTGPFERNHQEVEALMKGLDGLLKQRKELKETVSQKLSPMRGTAQRLEEDLKFRGFQSRGQIAKGLSKIGLDDYVWTIPEEYLDRFDSKRTIDLALALEKSERTGTPMPTMFYDTKNPRP